MTTDRPLGAILLPLLLTGVAGCDHAPAPGETRPNVILIITDDQGYGDLGATGNPVIRTPHLDAMAERSAQMTTFYVSPVCAPTRASLMTGRYNYRTRAIDTFIGRAMMDPEEVLCGSYIWFRCQLSEYLPPTRSRSGPVRLLPQRKGWS